MIEGGLTRAGALRSFRPTVHKGRGMSRDTDLDDRLRRLRDRIGDARRAQDPPPESQDHHTQAQLAWRMVTELVAGLLVGFGIGLGLDALFGTRPLMLVLFTLLGFAAGVRVMLRTASEVRVVDPPGGAKAPGRDSALRSATEEDGKGG